MAVTAAFAAGTTKFWMSAGKKKRNRPYKMHGWRTYKIRRKSRRTARWIDCPSKQTQSSRTWRQRRPQDCYGSFTCGNGRWTASTIDTGRGDERNIPRFRKTYETTGADINLSWTILSSYLYSCSWITHNNRRYIMLGCHFGKMFQVTVAGGSYQDGLTAVIQGHPLLWQ